MTTIRLLDCEDDARSCNGEYDWHTVQECLDAVREGLRDNDDDCYLPWRVVDYDSHDEPELMPTLVKITGVEVTLDLEEVHGTVDGSASHKVIHTTGGKVPKRIK